ncbi:hypothetical protein BH11BAC7_BH11BAC7_11860 [soil metagenome]
MTVQINFSEHPDSLSALIAHAEILKNRKDFVRAREVFERAIELNPGDTFLLQRLALVTYKSQLPDPLDALQKSLKILSVLDPAKSIDPETLGLSGSIYKKLYEETNDEAFLDKAIWFYDRGFSLTKNHYNGINLAFLCLVKAANEEKKAFASTYYTRSVFINESIISICINLIIAADFKVRNDKEYIYETLAQAYLGLGQNHEVIKLIPTINEISKGHFDLDVFHEQNSKIIDALVKLKKMHPDLG